MRNPFRRTPPAPLDPESAWALLTVAIERTLRDLPWGVAAGLSGPWRRVGWLLALLGRPLAWAWAGAAGGFLRAHPPVRPLPLGWLRPLWLEVGRYAGWVSF